MDINQFIEKFKEIFDENVNLTPETYFKELDDWSSLMNLSLIAFADEEFGKEISGRDIRNVQTIEDLFNLLTK